MSSQLLVGGDDVNAIVVDYGSSSFRYGHAGEEAPTLVIPTAVGTRTDYVEDVIKAAERMETVDNPGTENLRDGKHSENGSGGDSDNYTPPAKYKPGKYLFPPYLYPRENVEVDNNVIVDGMIDNWDAFQAMMEYAFKMHRPVEPTQHPFLFSEPLWITKSKREQLCELIFDKFKAPAFFTVKSPVLTCFAHGKSSGLVVDSGKIHTTACAVHEGFCLVTTHVRSPLAGDFITQQCRSELERLKIDLTPQYLIKSKEIVELDQPPKYTKKTTVPKVTTSYHEAQVRDLISDFQQILAVSDIPLHDVNPDGLDTKEYVFPTGYHTMFGAERYRIPEYLFDPSLLRLAGGTPQSTALGVSNLIHNCLSITDQDIRQQLWGNILIAGGNSCIPGFVERVTADCTRRSTSSMKLKCAITGGNGPERSSERLFAPWTGASILGSLGTFQSMWISRSDYEEGEKALLVKNVHKSVNAGEQLITYKLCTVWLNYAGITES